MKDHVGRKPLSGQGLLDEIFRNLTCERVRFTSHAIDRLKSRRVSRREVYQILKEGSHESDKDSYKEHFLAWNYSILGRTIDGRKVRVIVSFENLNVVIITVVVLW
jgi:hypothetical protein